jgi:serine/threonine protein kinase
MSLSPFESGTTLIRTAAGSEQAARALPVGTRLDEFEILDRIGEGGFGIVYLAQDHSLERQVAVKEYMPWTLAARVEGTTTVTVRSQSEAETFQLGLRSFVNEARLLARFDHPALLKVYRFWEANGTAYMAMPFYEGPTLAKSFAARPDSPDEAELRALLAPLLDALAVLHAAKCYHRDISPDNILLTRTGPLLLDFGAARRVISDSSQKLTVILKEGYAPIEQYGTQDMMRQGPWTDIYALCGVVHYAITGTKPHSSIDRLVHDRRQPLKQVAAGRYGESFLRAIDAGMAIKPADRPKTIAEFKTLLGAPSAAPKKSATQHVRLARSRVRISILAGAAAISLVVGGLLLASLEPRLAGHLWWTARQPAKPVASMTTVEKPQRFNAADTPRVISPSPAARSNVPGGSSDLETASDSVRQLNRLLSSARTVIDGNGGRSDLVLSQALIYEREAQKAIQTADRDTAMAKSEQATSQARQAVDGFLDDLIQKYAQIAQKKMNENDLEVAEMAITKGKELERLKARFK